MSDSKSGKPSPPLPNLDGARHRDVEVEGVRLHVAEVGPEAGHPVLLVHGWPQHWWCWRKVVGMLPGCRCVMPDLRGHGWSDAPESGYEKRQLAADMRNLLDALAIERVTYVGHDWGAVAGFILATESPERISALIALSVPHPWPSLHDRLSPRRLAAGLYQVPLSTPVLGRALLRAGIVKRVLAAGDSGSTFTPEEAEVYNATLSSDDGARATVALYRTFLLRELPAVLTGLQNQALEIRARLIVGDRDPIVRGADLRGFEAHAAAMEVEWVPGAGHFLPEERPELVAERIKEILPG